MAKDDLVTVYTAENSVHAELIKNGLLAEGIQAFLEGINESVDVGLVPDVKIQVAGSVAQQAREWIEQHERSHADEQDEDEEE